MEAPDHVDLSGEYQRLIGVGYEKLIEKALFNKFAVSNGSGEIRGSGADLTKVFDATRTMLRVLTSTSKPKEGPRRKPILAHI